MTQISKLGIEIVIIIVYLNLIKIFSVPPGVISGNGNPALLIIIPLLFLLVWFGLTWFTWLRKLKLSVLIKLLIIIISIVIIVFAIMQTTQAFKNFEVEFIENHERRYGGPIDNDYLEAILDGINIHTNYLYFNYTTFSIFVSVLNIVAIASSLLWPPK